MILIIRIATHSIFCCSFSIFHFILPRGTTQGRPYTYSTFTVTFFLTPFGAYTYT